MAADCSKKEEKRILYDLDIPYEWPETILILVNILLVNMLLVTETFSYIHNLCILE